MRSNHLEEPKNLSEDWKKEFHQLEGDSVIGIMCMEVNWGRTFSMGREKEE